MQLLLHTPQCAPLLQNLMPRYKKGNSNQNIPKATRPLLLARQSPKAETFQTIHRMPPGRNPDMKIDLPKTLMWK